MATGGRKFQECIMAATIPFNKPFVVGKELFYIAQAVTFGNLGADGHFTQACRRYLEERFGIACVLLTPSCTAALELAAILCDLKPGDEVLVPSYTFVSTASAVVRLGAIPVFVDIRPDTLRARSIISYRIQSFGVWEDLIVPLAVE
jgi:dTDP-4-amino-4,6-dideoxygalactose transaminase